MGWILKMKWFLLVLGLVMGGIGCHVYQETVMKSKNYWENVGPIMDERLNPTHYNNDKVD
jgi:hypothetical protein